MDLNKEDIKNNPIYREEVIRYRARLDEEERINREKSNTKDKKSQNKLIIDLIALVTLASILWIKIIKPFISMF